MRVKSENVSPALAGQRHRSVLDMSHVSLRRGPALKLHVGGENSAAGARTRRDRLVAERTLAKLSSKAALRPNHVRRRPLRNRGSIRQRAQIGGEGRVYSRMITMFPQFRIFRGVVMHAIEHLHYGSRTSFHFRSSCPTRDAQRKCEQKQTDSGLTRRYKLKELRQFA